jgi:hypothetical protein
MPPKRFIYINVKYAIATEKSIQCSIALVVRKKYVGIMYVPAIIVTNYYAQIVWMTVVRVGKPVVRVRTYPCTIDTFIKERDKQAGRIL